MKNEINALNENNTWNLVKAPNNVQIVDSKWVYKIKKNNPNGVIKYKARLVARGFTQKYAENYWDTYAPVVKCSTIRLLLAMAVECNLMVDQIDVRNAYIKSDLKESIYMKQPKGFESDENMVCKLNKSLYGLKQAGYEWNKCINEFLVNEMKFDRLKSDPCVYKRGNNDNKIIISLYVDDILIFSDNRKLIDEFKEHINKRFGVEDVGECRKIIGIEVERTNGRLRICQTSFIKDLLKEYQMEDCKIERTPTNSSLELICPEENCENCRIVDSTIYRSLIGKLLYLAGSTRPDISFTISSLSRFNLNPHRHHWDAAKRVLQYLKGTMNYGIIYKRTGVKLYGHSDADWANCRLDRRSYTGFVIILGGAPISWEARKQPTVALSSTEAEYMAVTTAAKEILFCSTIIKELEFGKFCEQPINLFSDNLGAIKLASNVGFNSRTKHIDTRHHFIRELVMNGSIAIFHVCSEEMIADILTKGLTRVKHELNTKRIMDL